MKATLLFLLLIFENITTFAFLKAKNGKNKMENTNCPHCAAKQKEEAASEEFSLAVLVSLVPMLVFVLFGQVGLF